jgi:hypothetical protein
MVHEMKCIVLRQEAWAYEQLNRIYEQVNEEYK